MNITMNIDEQTRPSGAVCLVEAFTERTDMTDDELAKNENVKGAICRHLVENIKKKLLWAK